MSTETKEQKAARIQAELSHPIGSTRVFQHGLPGSHGLRFTEGIASMAETCGAYWLIDLIASHQSKVQNLKLREFQLWRIVVHEDGTATVTCHEDWDSDKPDLFPPVITQEIEFTDFPIPEYKLYVEGQPPVLLLPSEH